MNNEKQKYHCERGKPGKETAASCNNACKRCSNTTNRKGRERCTFQKEFGVINHLRDFAMFVTYFGRSESKRMGRASESESKRFIRHEINADADTGAATTSVQRYIITVALRCE